MRLLEALCRKCGDTFNPSDSDLLDPEGTTARHYVRTCDGPEQGEPCEGIGDVGEWVWEAPERP